MRPLRESLVGEPIRRVMGIVNGTTNYILTRMTEDGRVVPRGARRGPEPRLRRARSHRRRRGLRRRRQGRDHRDGRVRRARRRRRRLPRGHLVDHRSRHRRRRRLGYRIKLLAIVEHDDATATVPRSRCACTRRWCPRHTRSPRCATASTRCSSRAARSVISCSTAAAPGVARRASAVLGDVIDAGDNLRRGVHASIGAFGAAAPAPDRRARSRRTTCRSTSPIGRACWRRWPTLFGEHEVSIRSMEQMGSPTRPASIFITHAATERDVQATLHDLRGARRRCVTSERAASDRRMTHR